MRSGAEHATGGALLPEHTAQRKFKSLYTLTHPLPVYSSSSNSSVQMDRLNRKSGFSSVSVIQSHHLPLRFSLQAVGQDTLELLELPFALQQGNKYSLLNLPLHTVGQVTADASRLCTVQR